MDKHLTYAARLALALATFGAGGCSSAPLHEPSTFAVAGPRAGRPSCRVWDQDIFGRRYCRVRYVYDAPAHS